MITVVGSLNMDLFIETRRLPAPGETVLGRNFRRAPGGKGANQAVAVARMGGACAMIGAVGDDAFGDETLANLRAAGVDAGAVTRRAGTATGVAMITVDASGQNQIVVADGANGTLTPDDIRHHTALFRRSKAVIVQLEIPLPAVEATLRLGREAGALTVLNPAPCLELSDNLLRCCDWIAPNEVEAAQLSGVKVRERADAAIAAKRLRKRSGANVLVTLGDDGVWIDTNAFAGHVPGFKVAAVDTVGAGDTFIGAFVTQLAEGAVAREAARFGCAAAALSVTRRGAQAGIPHRNEVEAWLRDRTAGEV
jgi:ribokinase